MSEKRIAIHEAGHQVAAFRLGFEISTLSIDGDGETLGRAFSATDYYNEEGATKTVTAFCAGYAALIAAGYPEEEATNGCGQDFDEAAEAIETMRLGGLYEWKAKAVELMMKPENVRAVELIAAAALEYRTLSGEHQLVLIELADGEVTEAEYKQWLESKRPAWCVNTGRA